MSVQMLPRNIPCLLPVLQVQLGAQRLRMNPVTSHCQSRKDWTNCLKDWKEEMLSDCKTSVKLSNLLTGKLVPDCVVDMQPLCEWFVLEYVIVPQIKVELWVESSTKNYRWRSPVPGQRTMYLSVSLPKKKALETNKQTRRVWRGGLRCVLLCRTRRHTKYTKRVP